MTTHLAELFDRALEEVIDAILGELKKGRAPRHRREAELGVRPNGMPSITDGSHFNWSGSADYPSLLEPPYDDDAARNFGKYPAAKFPALHEFIQYAQSAPPDAPGLANPLPAELGHVDMYLRVEGAAEVYFRRFGAQASTAASRKFVARSLLRGMQARTLDLAMIVPIALTRFELDHFRIAPDVFLMKMSPALQRARWSVKAYGGGAHEAVLAAATHAFVFTGKQIPNDGFIRLTHSLSQPDPSARAAIDTIFAALRLVTGVSTGFAQELWLARNWSAHHPYRPEVIGIGVRRYPDRMDDFGWTANEVPLITREDLQRVKQVYLCIRQIVDTRLGLALRRLNAAMTRDEPADAILDATIALEILLGDDDSQAISWKLRMRAAALAGLVADQAAMLKMRDVLSRVYSIRSAIVHGARGRKESSPTARDAAVKEADDGARLAIDSLRSVLNILVENPRYFDPLAIDRELLLAPVLASGSSAP
ncbi:HEPN domain-containing protein [Mesorhizobium mediterraneum]|uniref:HEPN domain-containing protein n=1 Tax=Mesorhizobium mediterraneum TaxID=43617 RepID=UPI00177CAF42|nr:HEPN domain-containing protein [Mesorhizobium mediterraneum]